MAKRGEYYVSRADMITEIKIFKKTKIISENLGIILTKIANKYASKPNFSGYTYKEDFIGDAIYRMIEQLDKINLDIPNSNPFSYLTQTCHNKFIAKINEEKKFSKLKTALMENNIDIIEHVEDIYFSKKEE